MPDIPDHLKHKLFKYRVEAVFLYFFFYLFKFMPIAVASSISGFIGRCFGRFGGVNKRVISHLKIAFPDKNDDFYKTTSAATWDNLGRIFGEYPHLKKLEKKQRVTLIGEEHLTKVITQTERPILFMTGHFGNWEIMPFVVNKRLEDIGRDPLAIVYRKPNNPYADRLIQKARGKGTKTQLTKSAKGARGIVKLMRQGYPIGMLVDQKMNEGIPVPFFGKMAMTITSVGQLAFKYDAIVLPCYPRRTGGANFDVIFEEPMQFVKTGEIQKDIEAAMLQVNQKLESWIIDDPKQWLWLHRRWPKKNKNK